MFVLLLSAAYTKAMTFLLYIPPHPWYGVHKDFEWNTAGTDNPNLPQRDSVPHDTDAQHIKLGKEEESMGPL